MDNNTKAKIGKMRFLELHPGAVDASGELVRRWLQSKGLEAGRSRWLEITVAPDLPPRYLNTAFTARSVDGFTRLPDGQLQGVELKISGDDGVCGLTINEERLLRAGHIQVVAVNPVKGLLGPMDVQALLEVRRRVDGIPVGQARLHWQADLAG